MNEHEQDFIDFELDLYGLSLNIGYMKDDIPDLPINDDEKAILKKYLSIIRLTYELMVLEYRKDKLDLTDKERKDYGLA